MVVKSLRSRRILPLACAALAGLTIGVGATLALVERDAELAVAASPSERAPGPAGLTASALSVIDGDTLEARVSVFPGQEIVTRVRLAGVDAPERRGRCADERDAAEKATRALGAMVEGRRLTLTEIRGDKYFGRVVARVATERGDLADALVAGGYGRPYDGGRREGWC